MRAYNHSRRLSASDAKLCREQAKRNGEKGYGAEGYTCGDTVKLRGLRYTLIDLRAEGDGSYPVLLSLEGDGRNLVDSKDVTWNRLHA